MRKGEAWRRDGREVRMLVRLDNLTRTLSKELITYIHTDLHAVYFSPHDKTETLTD